MDEWIDSRQIVELIYYYTNVANAGLRESANLIKAATVFCCKVICTSDIWTEAELSKPVYLDANSSPTWVICILNRQWFNGPMV